MLGDAQNGYQGGKDGFNNASGISARDAAMTPNPDGAFSYGTAAREHFALGDMQQAALTAPLTLAQYGHDIHQLWETAKIRADLFIENFKIDDHF